MYRRLYAPRSGAGSEIRAWRTGAALTALAALPGFTGGCVQMTRHSNMMIFGTNTVVGIRAGTGPTSVPEVAIGYARQEAVVLPLVANVGETGDGNRLTPCDPRQPAGGAAVIGAVPPPAERLHSCLLAGSSKGPMGEGVIDSYSVLASFGGRFGAAGSRDTPKAEGGVAQYFATGVAAQNLALNGGAAAVAVSPAATRAAGEPAVSAISAFGDPAGYAAGPPLAKRYPTFETKLTALIEASDDATIASRIAKFDRDAGLPGPFLGDCTTVTGCLAAVGNGRYEDDYPEHADALDHALTQWK